MLMTRAVELFTDCSLSSILERTKFKTTSVAIVRRVAATINNAFLPFRMLSPLSLPRFLEVPQQYDSVKQKRDSPTASLGVYFTTTP
jgi:hypothetical protein